MKAAGIDPIEARHWARAAEFLSLDLVRPFYADLGVGIPLEETVKGILRDALLHRFTERNAVLVQDTSVELCIRNLLPALDKIAAACGADADHRLRYWVRYIYSTDDNPWELYQDFLSEWASRVRRQQNDSMNLFDDAMRIAWEYKRLCDTDNILTVLNDCDLQPFSAWDRKILKRRGINLAGRADITPVADEIFLVVCMARFQPYFRRLAAALSHRERLALEAAVANHSMKSNPPLLILDLLQIE